MNLPHVIMQLIAAQNSFDSQSYVECFTAQAIVHDEGQTHQGQAGIKIWIEKANAEYQTVMKPVDYESKGTKTKLSAELAGNFPGSPAILQFHLTLENDLISALQ